METESEEVKDDALSKIIDSEAEENDFDSKSEDSSSESAN
jgi:hypothetical protein